MNRLNDLVIFRPLTKEFLYQVIELELAKLQKRLETREIYLTLDKKAKEFLVDAGFQPEMGARPIRRVIEQRLEDSIAEKVLEEPTMGRKLHVTVKKEELVFEDKEVFPLHQTGKKKGAGKKSKKKEEAKEEASASN